MRLATFGLVLLPALIQADQTWDGLRVTWDLNPFNSWAFDALPRDLNNDNHADFNLISNECDPGKNFRGARYRYKTDPAVNTLYDVNGYIAGVQTSIPKSKYTPTPYNQGHPFIDDGDFWTLTLYTVDPSTICTTGRTAAEFAAQGTGTGFWIQNGTDPVKDSFQVPAKEADIGSTKWKLGHCFVSMGNHYWYNVATDMDCDQFFPFFLLYNKGVINAGGFAINAMLDSKRYEHPTLSVVHQFMVPVPECFSSNPVFTTMHVYYTDWPRTGCLC